jgi:hypothetical protein
VKEGKPFFFRIDAARFLSEMARIKDDSERGKIALQLAFDLVDGKGNTTYSRQIIAEAKSFSTKKSEAGRKGMENRWLRDNTVITKDNTDITQPPFVITRSSNRNRNSTETTPESKVKRFVPPSVEEVHEYMTQIEFNGNAQKFVDHYTANGWMVGKNKMKDWKAAVRTWRGNDYGQGTTGGSKAAGTKTGVFAGDTDTPAGESTKDYACGFVNKSDQW